jgi:c-di-GMP-binding flagellar brake protein YcgR
MNSQKFQASASVGATLDSDRGTLERRAHTRHDVHVQIELHPENCDFPMRLETTDLSRGGCYIQLMMPLPVGIKAIAKLWLGDQPIVAHCRVVTKHPQYGNGIMFVDFEDQGEPLLNRYIDKVVG